jgi:hypothetical protein
VVIVDTVPALFWKKFTTFSEMYSYLYVTRLNIRLETEREAIVLDSGINNYAGYEIVLLGPDIGLKTIYIRKYLLPVTALLNSKTVLFFLA